MRDTLVGFTPPAAPRTVNVSMTVSDPLPRFTHETGTDSGITGVITSYTSNAFPSDQILYRAVLAGANKIYTHLSPLAALNLPKTSGGAFWSSAWVDTTVSAYAGSQITLYKNNLYYQAADKSIKRAPILGSGLLGVPDNLVAALDRAAAIVPLSDTTFLTVQILASTTPIALIKVIYHDTDLGLADVMPGYIYAAGMAAPLAGGGLYTYNGIQAAYLYITVTEKNADGVTGQRTLYLKRTNGIWSEIKPVIPLDIIDDQSSFSLTGVCGRAGLMQEPLITGVLKRKDGVNLHVYLRGPEDFTMGRQFFITELDTDKFMQLAYTWGLDVWYLGAQGQRYHAPDRAFLGGTDPVSTLNPVDLRVETGSNQPFSITANLPASTSVPELTPGSEVVLTAENVQIGRFNLDSVAYPKEQSGRGVQISGRSSAMKALMQWRSDAFFDYWSQTKSAVNPKELTKVIRIAGTWKEREGAPGAFSLSQEQLNTDGILYLTAKACRNGEMKGRFCPITGDFETRFGVGMNYYRETKYEAAARLGKETEQVKDDECGNNGIFAVWGAGEHNSGAGVALYHVHDNTWEKLSSAALSCAGNVWHWLMIRFHEGRVKVYYRLDTATSWTLLMTVTIASYTYQPWKRDQEGRGALFLRPVTPYSTCYAFASDHDIVPVVDNSIFNNTDIVLVDSERIHYTGKSRNINIGGLQFKYGDLIASGSTPSTAWVKFGGSRYWARLIEKFTTPVPVHQWWVRALRVYVKKIYSPKDGLNAGFWVGPTSEATPIGALVGEQRKIAPDKVDSDGGWVTVDFAGSEAGLAPNATGNWFILERYASATHPNKAAYYAGSSAGAETDQLYTWDEQNDLWNPKTGRIPFEIYAIDRDANTEGNDAATDDPTRDPDEMYSVYVAPNGSLSTTNDYYNNQALVVDGGALAGTTFKILGSVYRSGKNYIFYVDKDPSGLDETSTLRVAPTLYVTKVSGELRRGYAGTLAAAHGAGRQVDTWRTPPYIECNQAEYYSGDPDLTLEEMTRVIARKAGVLATTGQNTAYYSGVGTGMNIAYQTVSKNSIIFLTYPAAPAGTTTISARGGAVKLAVSATALTYAYNNNTVETFTLDQTPIGILRVSFQDGAISVWISDRFLHTFTMAASIAALTSPAYTITSTDTGTVTVRVPEANSRVDNYVLDAGRTGEQLLSSLIGESRFFYQDDKDGGLRLFHDRVQVNSSGTAYAMAVSEGETYTDASLATRVRLEGAEVKEGINAELMREYGNLFYQANLNAINSLSDAEYYVAVVLGEFQRRTQAKRFTGAADGRIEPNDIIWVNVAGTIRPVIAEMVGFSASITDKDAVYDMNVEGVIDPTL